MNNDDWRTASRKAVDDIIKKNNEKNKPEVKEFEEFLAYHEKGIKPTEPLWR